MDRRHLLLGLALAVSATWPASGQARFAIIGGGGQAAGVKLPADAPVYWSSGAASSANDGVSMKAQALAAMARLETNITAAGCAVADVAFVRAYLKPDKAGTVDYGGWEEAWTTVFPAASTRPARTTVAMPLASERSGLIEVEYVCVSRAPAAMAAASAALPLPVSNPALKPFGTKEGRILAGMGVMPGSGLYWTAGLTAPVLDANAPAGSYGRRGDMRTQARNTLARLKENIAGVGLTLADVVYVRAFLGPDANQGGTFDVDAWNAAYLEFFNNPAQPHKPARVTMTSPSFASNGSRQSDTLIEIEFVAAFPKTADVFDAPAVGGAAVRVFGAPTALFAAGVAVKPGASLYLSSAAMPSRGGDMHTQARSALESLQAGLAKAGAGFGDVAFLRAYLVANADGTVDRDGWNQAYSAFFNNAAQPGKPGRVTIVVSSLPRADARIAIDVVSAVP